MNPSEAPIGTLEDAMQHASQVLHAQGAISIESLVDHVKSNYPDLTERAIVDALCFTFAKPSPERKRAREIAKCAIARAVSHSRSHK